MWRPVLLTGSACRSPQRSWLFCEAVPAAEKPAKSNNLSDAREVLTVLGYSRSEVAAAMKNVDPTKSTEDIIKDALAALMKN